MRRSRATAPTRWSTNLRAKLGSLPGTSVRGMKVASADDFAYHDPVDGRPASTRASGCCSKAVRASSSGCPAPARRAPRCASISSATSRTESRHDLDTQEALADLIAAADDIAGIKPYRPQQAERDYLRWRCAPFLLPLWGSSRRGETWLAPGHGSAPPPNGGDRDRLPSPLIRRLRRTFSHKGRRGSRRSPPLTDARQGRGGCARMRPRGEASLGGTVTRKGIRFAAWSHAARRLWVSIFDEQGKREIETARAAAGRRGRPCAVRRGLGPRHPLRLSRRWRLRAGARAVVRSLQAADRSLRRRDRQAFRYDWRLAQRRGEGADTAPLMPKAIAAALAEAGARLRRPCSARRPDLRSAGARLHHAASGHCRKSPARHDRRACPPRGCRAPEALGVGAVELMPVTASIDERHLPPLGLTQRLGLQSRRLHGARSAPGAGRHRRIAKHGRRAARRRHRRHPRSRLQPHRRERPLGPTLSLRGLDNQAYYGTHPDGRLANDTGTGNTVACDHPVVQEMVLDTLRHFVSTPASTASASTSRRSSGTGRRASMPRRRLLRRCWTDEVLADRIMIAEPWDIGPGRLPARQFPGALPRMERPRIATMQRFWRGDAGMVGALATRLAGSSDVFAANGPRQPAASISSPPMTA
jgi:hypothetical protein